MEYAIQVKGLQKRYKDKTVLKDVNFNIAEGEIFGLLGPSGAGKTTLVKILTSQLRFDHGKVMVLEHPISQFPKVFMRSFGMVLDDSGVYERLTCYDNLKLFADIYGVPKRRIHEVLAAVGLEGAKKMPVSKLSKGMKQRLILARAILHEPRILFLDEPTSGLDPATARQIHGLLLKLKSKNTTILLTTHNMEEAAKLCEHVALLNEGVIVENGEPEELSRKYYQKKAIRVLLTNGEVLELPQDSSCTQQLDELLQANQVETIHSLEPDLEQVFLKLTGRRLVEE